MEKRKFDDIFQQLTFGVKPTKNAHKPNAVETRLPLRVLPKDNLLPKKRQKLEDEDGSEGIKLFSDSITAIDLTVKSKNVDDLSNSTDEKITRIRQLNHIYTWGSTNIPDPFINFKDLNLPKQFLKNIKEAGFEVPTPIQMQAIPIMLSKRNLFANAPTGSGKTLAFILPILQSFLPNVNKKSFKGVNAVILCPTNVLSQQIYVEFLKFTNDLPIKVALLEPGTPIDNANILVSTPNKFIYSLKKESLTLTELKNLRWLILDEADRLFETTEGDRNFRLQFDEIHKACDGLKTKLAFFSATFSFELEKWCKDELEDPIMICVGNRNSSNSAVKQELVYAGSERGKVFALEQMLNGGFEPPALVFLQSKERAGSLFVELQARCPKVPIRLISSDLTREACDKILEKFRSGEIWVLIATEMLGRGLDLPGVNLVVNFDLPNSIISYIHRVGRTGRAGLTGKAVTFYTYNDLNITRPIATIIKQAGFEVPEYTLKLDKLTKKQRKWLLKHAPKRKNVGSVGRWNRVKKHAMIKDKIVKHDPKVLMKRKRNDTNEKSTKRRDLKKPKKTVKASS